MFERTKFFLPGKFEKVQRRGRKIGTVRRSEESQAKIRTCSLKVVWTAVTRVWPQWPSTGNVIHLCGGGGWEATSGCLVHLLCRVLKQSLLRVESTAKGLLSFHACPLQRQRMTFQSNRRFKDLRGSQNATNWSKLPPLCLPKSRRLILLTRRCQ